MKNKSLSFIFLFLLFVSLSASVQAEEFGEMTLEERSDKQIKVKSAIQEALTELKMTEEDLNEQGDYYLDEEQNPVFQVKEDNDSTFSIKETKNIDKLIEKIEEKLGESAEIEQVKYSFEELVEAQDAIADYIIQHNVSKPGTYQLSLNTVENRIDLTVQGLTSLHEQELKKLYGDRLYFDLDENFEIAIEFNSIDDDRRRTYNKLGAGIGIAVEDGRGCTIGAIAHKDGQYYIVTAGHCLNSETIYQFRDTSVGRIHVNSIGGGYDGGLISIKSSSLKRYATNGLLSQGLVGNEYDKKLVSSMIPRIGDVVCMDGLTSNHRCATITKPRTVHELIKYPGQTLVGTQVKSYDGRQLGQGGDSGAPWHYGTSTGQSLVGIHSGTSEGSPTIGYFTPWVEYMNKYGLSLYTSNTVKALN